MFDGGLSEELPEEVARFCAAGTPPVAITFGSGMRQSAALFRTALEACELLGVRAIFLSRHLAQLPANLPQWAGAFAFAPFRALFPKCAAVVHHGGVGTTARVLAAGTPQLILPFAWDQRDNAQRVRRLGVGDQLGAARSHSGRLAAALKKLLSGACRHRCQAVRDAMAGQDGLENAVRWIEDYGGSRNGSSRTV
jgi:UDP:flavonoid glycosyltransferase YjiC (YdhE family)